jgi:hypothetical protein
MAMADIDGDGVLEIIGGGRTSSMTGRNSPGPRLSSSEVWLMAKQNTGEEVMRQFRHRGGRLCRLLCGKPPGFPRWSFYIRNAATARRLSLRAVAGQREHSPEGRSPFAQQAGKPQPKTETAALCEEALS